MEVNRDNQKSETISEKKDTLITFSEAWSELKNSPRELFIIFFLKFLESYSYFSIIYTLIIFLSEEFKYTDEQAGWMYGLFGMCTSLYGFIFGGFVIDNLGVKLSLCLGCSILLTGRLLLVVCSTHYYILLILYTILPIGTCLGIPVMQIGIRRFTTEKSRALAFSIFYMMMNVSAIFSASAIDFFRKYVSDHKVNITSSFTFEITAYRALFLSGACTTLCSLIFSVFLLKDVEEEEEKLNNPETSQNQNGEIIDNNNNIHINTSNQSVCNEEEESSNLLKINRNNTTNISSSSISLKIQSHENKQINKQLSGNHFSHSSKKKIVGPIAIIKEVASQKSFWKFLGAIILLMGVRIVYRHLDATFPKYMIREFGKDVMYGSIIAINPFLIVILIPVFAPLSYQFSAYAQITFGAFITSLSPFFLAYGPHLWSSIMFVVILSIGEALWSPRLYEYTIFITEKGREGIYMALASSPMFIATLVTGATSGIFLETFCPEVGKKESWKMWLLIGLITLTSPILLYLLKDKIEITDQELKLERAIKAEKKRLEEEREKNTLAKKFDYKNLSICNMEIDYKTYKIVKQDDFALYKID
jgi:MFS family permease